MYIHIRTSSNSSGGPATGSSDNDVYGWIIMFMENGCINVSNV